MAKAKKGGTASKTTGGQNALERVIAQIEKQYGQGSIMQMDESHYAGIEGISTGSLSLDLALGDAARRLFDETWFGRINIESEIHGYAGINR